MRIPESIETQRLLLRKPQLEDAEAIFARWASDPEATRYLSWSRHQSLADTVGFLHLSDDEWSRWPAGPYLVECRQTGVLIGSSGFAFEAANRAGVGYVLSRDAWGLGYATEMVRALVKEARTIAPLNLFAVCHPDNTASMRVLEKCGFMREGVLSAHARFPNLCPDRLCDALSYSREIA